MSIASFRHCVVQNCNQPFSRLFKFPENSELLSKWKENLGIEGNISSKMKVCEVHFEESAFGKSNIKYNALPTKLLGRKPIHLFLPNKKKNWRECCIVSCETKGGSGKRLFKFPENFDDKNTWLLACNMDLNIKQKLFICKDHFQPKYLGSKKLLYGAVPEFHLESSCSDNGNNTPPVVVESLDQFSLHTQGQNNITDISFEDFESFSILEEQRQELMQDNILKDGMCNASIIAGSASTTNENQNNCHCSAAIERLEEIIYNLMGEVQALRAEHNIALNKLDILMEALDQQGGALEGLVRTQGEGVAVAKLFPVHTVQGLEDLESQIDDTNRNLFIDAIKSALQPGGVLKSLRNVLTDNVIMEYNVDGVKGKLSLKTHNNFYSVLIDSITSHSEFGSAEDQLRKAIQRQKKRYFKNNSMHNSVITQNTNCDDINNIVNPELIIKSEFEFE